MSALAIMIRFLGGLAAGVSSMAGCGSTVRHLPVSRYRALLMLASFGIRTLVVLSGFLLLIEKRWEYALVRLIGFTMARLTVVRFLANQLERSERHLTSDNIVLWHWGWLHLNATLVYTWAAMLLLILVSWLVTTAFGGHRPTSLALAERARSHRGAGPRPDPRDLPARAVTRICRLSVLSSSISLCRTRWRSCQAGMLPRVRYRLPPRWQSRWELLFRCSESCARASSDISGII